MCVQDGTHNYHGSSSQATTTTSPRFITSPYQLMSQSDLRAALLNPNFVSPMQQFHQQSQQLLYNPQQPQPPQQYQPQPQQYKPHEVHAHHEQADTQEICDARTVANNLYMMATSIKSPPIHHNYRGAVVIQQQQAYSGMQQQQQQLGYAQPFPQRIDNPHAMFQARGQAQPPPIGHLQNANHEPYQGCE